MRLKWGKVKLSLLCAETRGLISPIAQRVNRLDVSPFDQIHERGNVPREYSADPCFADAEHTNRAALLEGKQLTVPPFRSSNALSGPPTPAPSLIEGDLPHI